jgi:aspartate/methionine/tyrosine aminotransferase
MMKSQDTILICPPVISQMAAVAALDVGRAYCEPYVRELAEIRQIVLGALGKLALLAEVPPADGAFYCLLKVNVSDRLIGGEGAPSVAMALAERLIREHKVAVMPGPAFGMTEGCYFRVSYGALQKETVAEGIGRLVKGLRAILG